MLRPSTSRGFPALGCAESLSRVTAAMRSIVSSIGAARDGRLFNVNADTFAAHLAGQLRASRLIVAGATAGVLDREGSTIAEMSFRDITALIGRGGATAGMIAKLAACRSAIEDGAGEVFIADGKDIAGLAVLTLHGRAAGAAQGTRVSNDRRQTRRQVKRKAS